MWLTVTQFSSNTNDKHRTKFACDGIFSLLRRQIGIALSQSFSVNKGNLRRQLGSELWKTLTHQIFCALHCRINRANNLFQKLHIAIFWRNHALPVPLIHIKTVQISQFFVSTDGIHIGVNAIAFCNLIFRQRQTLPLRQGVHHFCARIVQIFDGKIHRTLCSTQIIVDTQTAQHKKRCCDTTQTQCSGQVVGKKLFDDLDALFGFAHIEERTIVLKGKKITHRIRFI